MVEIQEALVFSSQKLTGFVVSLAPKVGLNQVTERWASLVTFLIFAIIFYIGIKISQPIIKTAIIILSIIIVIGLFIPW